MGFILQLGKNWNSWSSSNMLGQNEENEKVIERKKMLTVLTQGGGFFCLHKRWVFALTINWTIKPYYRLACVTQLLSSSSVLFPFSICWFLGQGTNNASLTNSLKWLSLLYHFVFENSVINCSHCLMHCPFWGSLAHRVSDLLEGVMNAYLAPVAGFS